MVRIYFLAAGLSCLTACAGGPFDGMAAPSWSPSGSVARAFRFDWRLSGDPAVAPMQVFDDGKDVWLQFTPGQALPAIFGVRGNGEHALPYVRRDPYVVVSGDWQALRFRGGRLAARAERDGGGRGAEGIVEPAMASALPEAAATVSAAGFGAATGAATGAASATATATANATATSSAPVLTAQPGVGQLAAGGPLRQDGPQGASHIAANDAVATPPPLITAQAPAAISATIHSTVHYRAAPPDTTLRGVLARWADSSGWTFAPQHWAVDVDIPLSASADFPGDFKSAVRQLLAATELADKPLQPCFYGNQVLRVVPLAQSCSRAVTPQGGGA